VGVGVLEVGVEDAGEVAGTDDQQVVEALTTDRPDRRSAFAFGARTGVRTISAPIERQTSSKDRVNVVSRSRTR